MTQTYVALDLEFTGLDPSRDEIIEIGAVLFDRRRELGRYQTFVRPKIPLPLQTERLTGIRRADLSRAPTFDEVTDALRAFIGDAPIVGQSIVKDIDALAHQGLALKNPQFDTFELASILLPDLPSYTLANIAATLGVEAPTAHRALADAIVARNVFIALLEEGAKLPLATLSQIVSLTSITNWDLRLVFQALEREQTQARPMGALGAALAAKGHPDVAAADFFVRANDKLPPLEPSRAPDTSSVGALLEPEGAATRVLPGYEHRAEQVEMARAVEEALRDGEHLIVEAGTGTGKSMAYLLPALDYARRVGRPVVLSTATLTLQDQIVRKDLPQALQVLAARDRATGNDPPLPRSAVVKGRTNYLCLRRWSEFRQSGFGLTLDEVKVLCRILVWLPRTQSGDRAELNLSGGETEVWSRISAQTDDCLTGTCAFQKRGTCFLYKARQAARHAHLVVVNHALLVSDLATENSILPDYRHLIVDEAHHLEDEATRQFGFVVGRRDTNRHLDAIAERRRDRVIGLVAELPRAITASASAPTLILTIGELAGELTERADACRGPLEAFFTAVGQFVKGGGDDGESRKRLTDAARRSAGWRTVEERWDDAHAALFALGDALSRLNSVLSSLGPSQVEDYDSLMLEVTAQLRANAELRSQIHAVVSGGENGMVTWVEATPSGAVTLSAAPLDVGAKLQDGLFGSKDTVVLTSATLSTEGKFAYVRERLGLSDANERLIGSPFDFAERALALVPSDPDFPEPTNPGYETRIADLLVRTARATDGRMLALFTSNASLRRLRQLIKPVLERHGIVVLGQNIDGPRNQLLNALRTTPRTVVLGAASFWEGVDIVGDALSVLVITRLPFGAPNDPVFAARSETFKDGFSEYAVPQAILRFRQGFGRLIRAKTDRGVALVLDTRLRTKGYGAAFRRSLPCAIQPAPAAGIPERVAQFLAKGGA